jgi:AAHS family benzoate transporter-like MFS transporter
VLTGLLVDADLAFPWGFYLFAVVGALGALALTAARAKTVRAAR